MDRTASLGSNMLTPKMGVNGSPETEVKKEQLEPPARQQSPPPQPSGGGSAGGRDGQIILVAVVLLLVGVFSWHFYLRQPPVVDTSSLRGLPMDMGSWTGEEIPIGDSVSEMLEADLNIQRAYSHRVGGFVWFYFGYYETDKGGEPVHTPPYCYRSQGWEILDARVVPLGSEALSANELIVQRDGEQRLVRFWYQSYNENGMLTKMDRVLARMQGLIMNGRSDGSLVRISTPLLDLQELPLARARLTSFVREMAPHLTQHWPAEFPPRFDSESF